MKKMTYPLFFLLFALFICSVQAAPGTLQVGIDTWLGYGTGFIAKEKGYFGDLSVDFVILEDWGLLENAFISGQTPVTLNTIDSIALASGKGLKGKVVLLVDESAGADGIVAGAAIKTAADLKGKKVSYTRASCSEFLLMQYLKANGMSMRDITGVEVDDPSRAGQVFLSGSADAAVTWEPTITEIVNSGKGHRLVTTKTFPDQLVDIAVANQEMLTNRKADLQKFVNGWLKAIEFIKTNPTEAYTIMAKGFKLDPNEASKMAEGVAFADLAKNKEWLMEPAEGLSRSEKLFDEANQAWISEKLLTTPCVAKEMFTSEFIKNAK